MWLFFCHLLSQGRFSFTVLLYCFRNKVCCCPNPSSIYTASFTWGNLNSTEPFWNSHRKWLKSNSLHVSPSFFFKHISVIIMICKSHFGEHLNTMKLSVCFMETVSSLRQRWFSLPAWHQIEGLCLMSDNGRIHFSMYFFSSLSAAPGCPNFLVGFWKMEARFWTRYCTDG